MSATHQSTLGLDEAVPPEVDAGTKITLKIKVSCPSRCDLRGGSVKVEGPDGVILNAELARHVDGINETDVFAIPAPKELGEHAWSIVFPRQKVGDVLHEETSLPISFRIVPHRTSIAIWDVPSPVAVNSSFAVKAGISCSAGCQLVGQLVEVWDEAGTKTGEGKLGGTPWPGTISLCWTDVGLPTAPAEGVSSWSVTFAATQSPVPHEPTSASFSFVNAKPPQHKVTVRIVAQSTEAPVQDVEVRLGLYAASTDEHGLAELALPSGTYDLAIRKEGFRAEPMTVNVSQDITFRVDALTVPARDEFNRRYPEGWWG